MASFTSLLAVTSFLCVIPLLRRIQRIYINYQLAKPIGLQILVMPLDPYGMVWQAGSRLFTPILQHFDWCRILDLSWNWKDGFLRHEIYGDSFMVVSPAMNILYTSDKVAIEEVLAKRKVFVKPKLYETLDMFGKNVDTVNGEEWSRHRKITAPCFNERVSAFVWNESLRQSQAMLAQWRSQPGGKISKMVDDTRIVALHVLTAAGFGVQHDFSSGARVTAPGHKLSHRDTLMTLLDNFITTMTIAPQEFFFDRISVLLSPRGKGILLALKEFRQYTDEAMSSERKLQFEERSSHRHNLMSMLIRTSDRAEADGVQKLTDDEIKGNFFIFNVAGHDTTANTLGYACALLAVHPDIQEWVIETDQIFRGEHSPEYEGAYPQLKRVMAVMVSLTEFLQYVSLGDILFFNYGPSHPAKYSNKPKHPSDAYQAINIPQSQVMEPQAMDHLNRYIIPNRLIPPTLQEEKLVHMDHGFAPWASGPRICPGKKFAQVQFTAVLGTILKRVWIAPSVKDGGDAGETAARKEVEAVLKDSHHIGASISMKRPDDLWLKVSQRQK